MTFARYLGITKSDTRFKTGLFDFHAFAINHSANCPGTRLFPLAIHWHSKMGFLLLAPLNIILNVPVILTNTSDYFHLQVLLQ